MGFFDGIAHAIGNIFAPHPQNQPQRPQQPQPRHDVIYDVGHFLQTHLGQPQKPAPKPAPKPLRLPPNIVPNLLHGAERAVGNVAQGVANTHLKGIEQLTHHPVTIGGVGNEFIKKPLIDPYVNIGKAIGNTAINSGLLGNDLKPYAGKVNPIKLAGDVGVGALNLVTLGKGGVVAKGATNLANAATKNIGNQVAKKAAGNLIKTSVTAAPITAGYGAGSVLQSGDANPLHVAQGAATGLALAPALGLAHGAIPIAGAGVRGTAKITSGLAKGELPGALAHDPYIGQQAGKIRLPVVKQANVAEPIVSKIAPNKFTQTVKSSLEVSPEVQAGVSGQHAVRNTKELIAKVNAQLDKEGEKAHDNILEALSVKTGTTSDETLAKAIELAKRFDEIGTPAAQDKAISLYDQVAEHGVGKGQGSQILSILARRSPAGLRNKAFKDLKAAGVELTPSLKKEIQGHIDAIRNMPDGHAKDFAIAVMQKAIAKHLPQSKIEQGISIWKAGLLSGVKTQQGNAISNATFGGLKKISDIPAVGVDKTISLVTGTRTKALTGKGIASGTAEGAKKGITTMKTGIDQRSIGDKYEQHGEINLGNKILQKVIGDPANLVFRGMSAADQPFYYATLKNSLYDQAKADGINLGLKGNALTKHMDEMVQNPTMKMADTAAHEAAKSVLAFDTAASKFISGARQAVDKSSMPDVTKSIVKGAINVIAPFTRVPSAFLSRTVDFTPLGVGREVFEQAASKKFDQRQLSQAIGEGLTGTGAIALGMQLSNSGQLSGQYPKTDQKEQQRWKAEGKTPNSIRLGGKWYSLNYGGPLGMLFGAGNRIAEAGRNKDSNGIANAALGLGQDLMGQSFLQGFSGLSDAIKSPEQDASKFLNSQVASLVPNWVNDIANLTDSQQRQSNNPLEAVQAKIPGLRGNLASKMDAFGNDLAQADGQLGTVSGIKPSKDNHNPLLNELDRLKSAGKDSTIFPIPDKTIQTNNQTIKLDSKQQHDFNKAVGQKTQQAWNQIIADPAYQPLSDLEKKQALERAGQDIKKIEQIRTLQAMGQTDLADKMVAGLSKREILAAQGNVSPADYASGVKPKPKAAPKVKLSRAKKVRVSVGRTKGRKVKIAKAPALKLKKIHIAKSPTIHTKKAKAQYAKLPKSTNTSKKIKLTA